jgi:hypothetical protein
MRKNVQASKTRTPFHYGIRDLFARFKENPSFQQTRALIRIMRTVVAGLWDSKRAQSKALIGAEDINLLDGGIISEIRQINSTLDAALAHDIMAEGNPAVAQLIDGGVSRDARDVATLIFLSSLSLAVNPTLGLARPDIVAYLAAPGRDVRHLREALDALQLQAWYLHATAAGALLFKNTENLNAKLEDYAKGMLPDQREAELRTRLAEMYAPKLKGCYGQVQALPALDQVQLNPDTVTLVIFRPSPQARSEIEQFYVHLPLKNRVVFLTGETGIYERVLESSAYLRAIGIIITELQRQNLLDGDPQLTEARTIQTKQRANFYQACRETFRQLFYPSKNGLTDLAVEPAYNENSFEGETAIITALQDAYKYDPAAGPNSSTFVASIVKKLWTDAKEMPWAEVKKRAATDPSWTWHHPRVLDETRREMVQRDQWRNIGNDFVARGPFPPPKPSVQVITESRNEQTGEALLRVKPLHGDVVYCTEPGNPDAGRRKLDALTLTTKSLRLEFVAENLSEKLMGDPTTWTNIISLKHGFSGLPGNLRCELRAFPSGEIRYTTDGSSPTNGQMYHEPFFIPASTRFIQAQASAEGLVSNLLRLEVPQEERKISENPSAGDTYRPAWRLDLAKPVTWQKDQKSDSTAEVFLFLEHAIKHGATLAGVNLMAAAPGKWAEFRLEEHLFVASTAVLQQATFLRDLVAGANLNLDVMAMRFAEGQQLEDLTHALRVTLKQDEVQQP